MTWGDKMLELFVMVNKKVFIVILNFQAGEYVVKCVNSILKNSDFPTEVVIVDNGSTDESVKRVRTKCAGVKIVENKQNLGFAEGNNVGIIFALKNDADYIFLLNPDTTIEKNTIENLLKIMKNNKEAGIVGPKIYSMDNKIWSCGGEIDKKRFTGGLISFGEKDHRRCNKEKEVDFVSGTAMFIRKEVFGKVGLLPGDYFLYYEDIDFCLRAKKAGYKIYFVPNSILYHDWSSIIGKKSPMKEYFMARNHLLFLERHAPLPVKLRESLRLPKTLYEHYRKNDRFALLGIRDYFLRRFGKRDYWS